MLLLDQCWDYYLLYCRLRRKYHAFLHPQANNKSLIFEIEMIVLAYK